LAGLKVQGRPGGDEVEFSVTVPVKPLTGATIMTEVAVPPELAAMLAGLAVNVKS